MLKNIFLTAWRNLYKQARMSFINLAGLSIGMTAAILIMLWVQNERSYDNYHPGAKNIYRITNYLGVNKTDTWVWENSPLIYAELAMKQIPEIESVARMKDATWGTVVFNLHDELFKEKSCAYVDSNWFGTFHYDIISGSVAAFDEHPYSLALTKSKAKKYFGNNNPVGQIIQIDSINYTVQLLLEDNPVNSSFQYDVLLPLKATTSNPENKKNDAGWGNFNYISFVKLHNGANKYIVENKLTTLLRGSKKKDNIRSALVQLPDMHFETNLQNSAFRHTDKKTVTIFTVLAVLLLLTACINYVNLTTARASLRSKEVSIRKIVGAGRIQLFRQFMTESLLISFAAMVITLLLVSISIPFFNQLTENHFIFSLTSLSLWKILGGTLLFTTVLNGIYPAMLLSSFKPLNVFRGISVLKVNDAYFRKALVVAQFFISVVLIVGTIVIYKQMQFIQRSNSAYDRAQIVNVSVPWRALKSKTKDEQISFIEVFKQELLGISSVDDVSVAGSDIINNTNLSSGGSDWEGRPKDFEPGICSLSADATFQKMFNLQLVEGRWYRDHDKADEKSFIINETGVKELNLHKPVIGQWYIRQGDTGKIIGVVKDFHYRSIHDKIGSLVLYNEPSYRASLFIKVRGGQSAKAVAAINNTWKKLLPAVPFELTFLDQSFDKLYKDDTRVSILILVFSMIAAFISALGLFGLAAFTAEKRTKEIGIRKVLGASIGNIVGLLSREFIYLVLMAIVIATPVGWLLMNKWLENFAYKTPLNAGIFFMSGFAAIIIALLTVSIQATRAAMANPVKSLRTE